MNKEQIRPWLDRLEQLDNGTKAVLRRNAHAFYDLADSAALGAFLRSLHGFQHHQNEEPALFAVACCHCVWKTHHKGIGFAKAVKKLESSTAENRFLSLLDEPMESHSLFAIKFYRLMHMLRANELHIDWERLTYDLLYWSHPDRFVQRNWAHEYFNAEIEKPNEEQQTDSEKEDLV